MSLSKVSVVLADDHAMVRESLARVLEDSGRVVVKGQANDGRELLAVVRRELPDCVVLDYSMPELDGPAAIEQLASEHRHLKLLVLTVHEKRPLCRSRDRGRGSWIHHQVCCGRRIGCGRSTVFRAR